MLWTIKCIYFDKLIKKITNFNKLITWKKNISSKKVIKPTLNKYIVVIMEISQLSPSAKIYVDQINNYIAKG